MTLRMETVRLEDVHPIRDEYGNEYTSRDYSAKANKQYVQELADSMRAKGEPDEPITLIQDGGIYYIKAGRSRYEAMRLLGTERCQAIIDEDDTAQSVLETVIRTDTKKKYEAVEESRFVQQLTMFGDDEYVSDVTGIEPEKVAKIRRARVVVDEAGDDMTIDRLFLVDEFSDDPEAVKRLTNCKESEAAQLAERLRRERETRQRQAAFEAALGLQRVPAVKDRQGLQGLAYYVMAPNPAEVADCLPPEWEDGQVVAYLAGNRCEIYVDPKLAGGGETEEQAAMRQQADAYREAIRAMDAEREAWFLANLEAGRPMPNIEREAAANLWDTPTARSVIAGLPDGAKAAVKNCRPSALDILIGYYNGLARSGVYFVRGIVSGEIEEHMRPNAGLYLDTLTLHQADGWDPGDGRAIVARISKLVDGESGE